MITRQGISYYMENGKYTVDGYDLFDTIEELEADLDWELECIEGRAYKDLSGWHRIFK